jgi:hypothetical protein
MTNWIEIKKKILFSYMGCDWTSIKVSNSTPSQVKDALSNNIIQSKSTGIYLLNVADVEVCFYLDSDQHFDFDPKQVENENQWNKFLDFFKRLSLKLNSEVLFRPEDSDFERDESILLSIFGENVKYNFDVENGYTNDGEYRK